MRTFRVLYKTQTATDAFSFEADIFIIKDGTLMLYKNSPSPSPDFLVIAFAPGAWLRFWEETVHG